MASTTARNGGSTAIRTDDYGRFCLNDLHKASGGADHHRPKDFLRLKQTAALVAELNGGDSPFWRSA